MRTLRLPDRSPSALAGAALASELGELSFEAREARISKEILAGNVPGWLRGFTPVTVSGRSAAGVTRSLTFEVLPDYLSLGSDSDYLRMPMSPLTAQAVCDEVSAMLPTTRMVDEIYRASKVKVGPYSFNPNQYRCTTVPVFALSSRHADGQLAAAKAAAGAFVGGVKKDVVNSRMVRGSPGKVAIYGWHLLSGQAIQPLFLGHDIDYVDYSHGIRLVSRSVDVQGEAVDLLAVLADPELAFLVSGEGPVEGMRYRG